MATDDDDALHVLAQREQVTGIAQQHAAFFDGALRGVEAGLIVDRLMHRRQIEVAVREHGAQDAADHVVQARLRHHATGHGQAQRFVEIHRLVEHFTGRLLVQAGQGRLGTAVHAAPIGHHETGELPFLLEHLVHEVIVFAAVGAVDTVVRAHRRTGLADVDGDLEGQQVRLAHRLLTDLGAVEIARGLHVVEREVLHRGDHVLALHAADRLTDQHPGQQGIFTGVFEVAAVARIALQVDAAGQQDVEALLPGFAAHGGTASEGDLRVPAGGRGRAGRQCSGVVALAQATRIGDAQASVGRLLRGNAQTRDARHETGRTHRTFRQRTAVFAQPEVAVQHLELLIHGHLRDQRLGTGIGVQAGIHPRRVATDRRGIAQRQQRGRGGALPAVMGAQLDRSRRGGLEAIAEVAFIGFQRDARRIEACGGGRIGTDRAQQHGRRAQARTGDQRRQCSRIGGAGVQRDHVAAIVEAQVIQRRLLGARFGLDRQAGQHDAAGLLRGGRIGGHETIVITQRIGQALQRIHAVGAAFHVAHGHCIDLQLLQLRGDHGGVQITRGLFQGQHGERVGGGGRGSSPGGSAQRERNGGRQGQGL
ncbi:hypothetical protein D3C71_1144920 [compost metagenome]